MAQAKAREKPTGVATNAILAWEERSMVTQWIDNWTVKSANICVHLPRSTTNHCKENSRTTQNRSRGHYGTYMPLAMKESDKRKASFIRKKHGKTTMIHWNLGTCLYFFRHFPIVLFAELPNKIIDEDRWVLIRPWRFFNAIQPSWSCFGPMIPFFPFLSWTQVDTKLNNMGKTCQKWEFGPTKGGYIWNPKNTISNHASHRYGDQKRTCRDDAVVDWEIAMRGFTTS